MSNTFTFRIAGSYTPATIPLERLGEYLVALGKLLGEEANVHFDHLSEGSTVVHASVEPPAVPKVERRIRDVATGEAEASALKAAALIDDMLRDDNATGRLSGGLSNVLYVDFAGRNRPTPVPYGPIKQIGVVEGEVFRVEGKDDTVHVGIMDGQRSYKLIAHASMGQELASLFRAGLVRFHGEGTWFRHQGGEWELRKFKIDRFEAQLAPGPVSEVVSTLRKIGIGEWSGASDPIAQILSDRSEGVSEH